MSGRPVLSVFARLPVLAAVGAQAVVLLATNNRYGYFRDELYFRMLRPGWGYVDQPPFTPLIARLSRVLISDSAWAMRLPAVAAAAASVVLVALLAREAGGCRAAQVFAAWAFAFASFPLVFGHVLITNSVDAPVWLGVLLCVVRARLRDDGRWWLVGGVLVGLGLYNKLLIVILLAALAVGILIVGPRRILVSRWVLGAIGLAILIGLPNVVYQSLHGWPQLTFGRALAAHKSGDTRAQMWPLLVLMLGPPLTAIWVSGLVCVWRRPEYRPIRFLAASFPVLIAVVFLLGSQPTYPFGLVAAMFAFGCVATVEWWRRGSGRRFAVLALTAVNSAISLVIALPLIPVSRLGDTPVPAINQTARDTVGWPAYVRQIASAYRTLSPTEREHTVLYASNYGEAGALDRYGPGYDLPKVYSGQNQLYFQARPPNTASIAVIVGAQLTRARALFADCRTVGRLDDGVGVDNEEQHQPIAICRTPVGGWRTAWPHLQHYD